MCFFWCVQGFPCQDHCGWSGAAWVVWHERPVGANQRKLPVVVPNHCCHFGSQPQDGSKCVAAAGQPERFQSTGIVWRREAAVRWIVLPLPSLRMQVRGEFCPRKQESWRQEQQQAIWRGENHHFELYDARERLVGWGTGRLRTGGWSKWGPGRGTDRRLAQNCGCACAGKLEPRSLAFFSVCFQVLSFKSALLRIVCASLTGCVHQPNRFLHKRGPKGWRCFWSRWSNSPNSKQSWWWTSLAM